MTATCSVWDNREVGAQLKEDLSVQPDPTLGEAVWEGAQTSHSRTATRSMHFDNDGDSQQYYTRAWTYDSVYGRNQNDGSRLTTHYEKY